MSLLDLIASINWAPGNGDTTVMGDVTVGAYALTAVLCLMAAFRLWRMQGKRNGRFWSALGLLFVFLTFNKHLNLQSGVTSFLRALAYDGDWYQVRQSIQVPFVISVLVVVALLLLLARWVLRSVWQQQKLAVFGALFLLAFITIRSASLHAVDALLFVEIAGLRLNWIFELGGIACVAAAALLALRAAVPTAPPAEVHTA